MKTVGVIANTDKLDAAPAVREALPLFKRARLDVMAETETARLANKTLPSASLRKLAEQCDFLAVFGGDGTILRVARHIHGSTTPILGVNLGTFGFLTAVSRKDIGRALRNIRRGEYKIGERAMLEVRVMRHAREILRHHALNDAVINRGAFSRLVRIEVEVDDELLTTYTCDGLIISTPTGSTAYSLSAGGPIISPAASAFAITPICPHALSNRSVIVAQESTIRAKLLPQNSKGGPKQKMACLVTVDGQEEVQLRPGDVVEARHSPSQIHMITLTDYSYFEVLRHKLHWSGSNV